MKDKLLCVLKSNIKNFNHGFLRFDSKLYICLKPNSVYKEERKEIIKKPKYFWQKEKVKFITEEVYKGSTYKMQLCDDYRILESCEITKEEYDEIFRLKKEQTKKDIEEILDKHCKE